MQQDNKAVGSVRLWEIVVAAIFLVFGAVVMWDSRRLGASWGSDGPQAGYFPFYIGLFIVVSSVINLYNGVTKASKDAFVEWGQLKLILIILIPTLIYVALIDNPWYPLGIYVPSIVFIAFFMRYLGKYGWTTIAAVSIGTIVAFFVMFEIWFSVPLPKGPIEAAFGYA